MGLCKRIFKWFFIFSITLTLCLAIAGYVFYAIIIRDLPDVSSLREAQYQMPFAIYSQDKALIAQFGEKKRTPISIYKIPQPLINAFLAAEDDRYYSHPGVDYKSLVRASWQLFLTGKKKQGASTITMQVIRNFLLTREKTYNRKMKEIILSLQIEQTFTKDQILELYLNKIYMGHSAYGVVAAAEVYYGKTLAQLTLAEQAMIAGLPKAPSIYNPITNPARAKERRDYVLERMAALGYAPQSAVDQALSEADTAQIHRQYPDMDAPYIAEMVRQEMLQRYGEDAYTSGMKVYTTITKPMQETATQALRNTLHLYDSRHGITDMPYQTFTTEEAFLQIPIIGDTYPAQVVKVRRGKTQVRLQDNRLIQLADTWVEWRKSPTRFVSTTLKINDLVRVRKNEQGNWEFTRIPEVQGAFACLNPINGAIVAIEGGFDFRLNTYNRATQSKRQPGSGFKPIIYTTALEDDFTVASIINDAPIVITTGTAKDKAWHPQNYSNRFYGPTPIRTALIHSRNIVAIRLLQTLGIDKVITTALRFGFQKQQLPHGLSLALGSGYASPLQMARMYAIFANGGFFVKPYLIERIEDYEGHVIFQANPDTACPLCTDTFAPVASSQIKGHPAIRIISPEVSFLMNSLLRDVVQRGTATAAKVLQRTDIAGKTGTTNDQKDAWFNGFTPNFAATAWVGFDSTKSLGSSETGGKAALPMWIDFMRTALKDIPEVPLQQPDGIMKASAHNPAHEVTTTETMPNGSWDYFIRDKVFAKQSAEPDAVSNSEPKARTHSAPKKKRKARTHSSNNNDSGESGGATVEELF
jgi:penicillin-binding protein 1A